MDLYTLSFFLSTMWVGPFWFGMLVYPEHDLTQKAMEGPWFFLGPILMWWLITLAEPHARIDLAKESSDPTTILDGLASLLGTPDGDGDQGAQMVHENIFVTRGMWWVVGNKN